MLQEAYVGSYDIEIRGERERAFVLVQVLACDRRNLSHSNRSMLEHGHEYFVFPTTFECLSAAILLPALIKPSC
ncbi:hypothetical protein SLE2022_029930 [Rubroshorea leprosula]